MQVFLEILFGGIAQGAVYCVFAMGLSLVYGIARVLNFSHGSLYMTGAYIAWVLSAGAFHLPYIVVFIILIPVLFILGVILERFFIRPLRWSPNWKVTTMMITLGIAFVLDNFFLIFFGPEEKLLPQFIEGTVSVMGVVLSNHKLLVFALAIIIVIGLEFILHKTQMGKAMRAVAQDMQGASMVGIRVNRIFSFTFGLSVVLAGVAGVLLAPIYLVSPLGGWFPFLKAFVIVVFGGLGSTRGVLYSAFILGIIEAFVIFQLGATWTLPVWLLTLLVVLMFRPQGLLGVWAK
jgi:branched-chain amino acid transport system permease protein